MKLIIRLFQQGMSEREGRTLAGRGQDAGIDGITKNMEDIKIKFMMIFDIAADIIETQRITDGLKEQVTAVEGKLFVFGNHPGRVQRNDDIVIFLVVLFGDDGSLFFGPGDDLASGHVQLIRKLLDGAELFIDLGSIFTVLAKRMDDVNLFCIFGFNDIDAHKEITSIKRL